MKKLIFLLVFPSIIWAQGQKIGVRSGLDFSKFLGPLEEFESYDFSTGFHFGINYSYYFTPHFGVGAELVYQQKGTKRSYVGEGFYPIHKENFEFVYERGDVDMSLDISTAYLSIPITGYIKTLEKFELFAGLSANFLINPVGNGVFKFTSQDNPDGLFFQQSLSYQFYEDDPGSIANSSSQFNPAVFCGDDVVTIPGAVGAYYHLGTSFDKEELIPWFDLTGLAGLNYYINKSFYIGGRVEYGLFDLTNDKIDYSLRDFNATGFNFRNDRDVHFGFQASVGFKF